MYLAKMTTAQAKEAFEKDPIIVIPVGSTEQHGTQGALGTDFMVPSYLADHVEDVDNVIVAPTVPYGVCPYHLSFEGSINIGYEGLYMVLHGIMDSLMQHGAKRFVVLNGMVAILHPLTGQLWRYIIKVVYVQRRLVESGGST